MPIAKSVQTTRRALPRFISFLNSSFGRESSTLSQDLRALTAKTHRVVGEVQGMAEGNFLNQKPGSCQLNLSVLPWGTLSLPCHNHTQIRAHKGRVGRMEQR